MSVYFIQSGTHAGPIKIGYTAGSPSARLSALQTGNPERLRLMLAIPGSIAVERELHARFDSSRMGGEWFKATPELTSFVDALQWTHRETRATQHDETDPLAAYGLEGDQAEFMRGLTMAAADHARIDFLIDMGDIPTPGTPKVQEAFLSELRVYQARLEEWGSRTGEEGPFSDGLFYAMDDGVVAQLLMHIRRVVEKWDEMGMTAPAWLSTDGIGQ